MIISLAERQNELEKVSYTGLCCNQKLIISKKTYHVLSAVINATELLQNHNQKLDQASLKTAVITDDLGRAAAAAKLWSETLSVERWAGWLADWGIRGTGGVVFSVVGYLSYPTLDPITMVARTVVLFFSGKKICNKFFCELANFCRHCNWRGRCSNPTPLYINLDPRILLISSIIR
jgi:hypothetical protein